MGNTAAEYRHAQSILWGQPGEWAHDTFDELNAEYFDNEVPHSGIVWGLTPHGGRLAHTSYGTGRITLHPALLDPRSDAWGKVEYLGVGYARDVLVHEMIHALLFARDVCPDHNAVPWCEQVVRLSPLLGLGTVLAAPVVPRRVGGKVVRLALPGHLSRDEIARWPGTLRDLEWYRTNRDRMRVRI